MQGTTVTYRPRSAKGLRLGIVRARFNDDITARLFAAAQATLGEAGAAADDLCVVEVSGAIELPLAAQRLLRDRRCDGVLALGCVIRGATDHYDHVCRLALDGLLRVMLDEAKPVVCAVITADTRAHAEARAGGAGGNLGASGAQTLLEMVNGDPS